MKRFYEALEASQRPTIASHSGCRALYDHPRNLTDDQLRALGSHGGVVGIVFHPGFLDAQARAEEARVRASPAYLEVPGSDATSRFLEKQRVMRTQARPLAAERFLDHVVHAVEVAGIDHVGIGSDYDGIERGPEWLEDAASYGILAELLLRRGFDLEGVEKVLGLNMERVFGRVTGAGTAAHAARILPIGPGPA